MNPLVIGALIAGVLVGFLARGAAGGLAELAARGAYLLARVVQVGLILTGAVAVLWVVVIR